jgi:hypothetical protein
VEGNHRKFAANRIFIHRMAFLGSIKELKIEKTSFTETAAILRLFQIIGR